MQHLPVKTLNIGRTARRYSWISYELGHLECNGKRHGSVYPSEQNEHRIENIETAVEDIQGSIQLLAENTTQITTEYKNAVNELKITATVNSAENEQRIETLESDVGDIQGTISDLNTTVTVNGAAIETIKEENEQKIEKLGSDLEDIQESIQLLVGNTKQITADYKNAVSELKTTATVNRAQIENIKTKTDKIYTVSQENQNAVVNLAINITEQAEKIVEHDGQIDEVNEDISKLDQLAIKDDYYFRYAPIR